MEGNTSMICDETERFQLRIGVAIHTKTIGDDKRGKRNNEGKNSFF